MNISDDLLASSSPREEFKPFAIHNRDGDCLEFFFENDAHYARRLDGWLTIYYSEDTNDIIGGLVKGVERLLQEFPRIKIEVDEGTVTLACLLTGPSYNAGDATHVKKYKHMIDSAERTKLTPELQLT